MPPLNSNVTEKDRSSIDMIAVLTGGQGRIKKAVELLLYYPNSILLISGVAENVDLYEILDANGLSDLGVDEFSRIKLDRVSLTTEDNVREIYSLAERLGLSSLLIVSSSYHLRRALSFFQKVQKRNSYSDLKVFYQPVESPNFVRQDWWNSLVGWKIFLSEYMKSWRMPSSRHADPF